MRYHDYYIFIYQIEFRISNEFAIPSNKFLNISNWDLIAIDIRDLHHQLSNWYSIGIL